MENATDALKIAAFTLLFIGALSIAMITLSKAKEASESIIYTQDDRNYYSFLSTDEIEKRQYNGNRYVTIESIIPSLYRYNIENYRIEFYRSYTDKNHNVPLNVIQYKDNRTGNWVSTNILDKVNETNEEYDIKESLERTTTNLIEGYSGDTFEEQLGVLFIEDDTNHDGIINDEDSGNTEDNENDTEKRTICYILQ